MPGPTYVYKCPNCGNLLTKGSLMSGNTFGARMFSDGQRIAPMLPEFPDLTKCKKCDTMFWLSKLKKFRTYYDWSSIIFISSEWENPDKTDKAEFLEIDEYYNAIIKGLAKNRKDERIIRKRIWWAYNDKIRKGQEMFIDESDELRWRENVTKLKALLNQSDINQKILIAEINRNLGDFDNCISIIQSIDKDDLNWLKKRFIKECKRKNKWVVELKNNEPFEIRMVRWLLSKLGKSITCYNRIKNHFLFSTPCQAGEAYR